MSIELKVPPVGESITEVVIGEWTKKEGDYVAEDETVAVLETDKVNMDVPAPTGGILSRILKPAGSAAQVGEIIGYLEAGEIPVAASRPVGRSGAAEEAKTIVPSASSPEPGLKREFDQSDTQTARRKVEVRMSPSKRRALRATGDEPVVGSRADGASNLTAPIDLRQKESVPMTPLRKRIAERLVQAQQSGALLTTFNEVDLSEVIRLRKTFQEQFKKKYGLKVGFMSFFIKAVIEGLKEFPAINAQIKDGEIIYHNYYDIGVAVGGGKGLVVPVLRNAERMSFAEIEQSIADFGRRARANQLKLDDLQGGTFTISNGGIYGSMLSTPIVNPPQSGILGMHNIQERPVARNGEVVIRPMMYLALSYDHRLVDGREAVTFLVRLKDCLETPSRMLLEI
jgi:2-oxoglutarate dehydrogenase E2 component (dihydrolipoamide succinyltransferase)